MILSLINGSLPALVLSVVASKRSARATWEALEQRYASSSQNRILFFRNELLQTKKGDLSVADYLDRMNVIADNLALAVQPVSDDELVQIMLNNPGPAFEMTVSAAQACDTPITYPTLEALLLTSERRMLEHATPVVEQASVTAFVAARGRGGGRGRGVGSAMFLPPIVVERRINEASTLVITTISAMLLEMGNDVRPLVSALSARYMANLVIQLWIAINE
ncbi:hypothetical protein FF1_045122 [Malus domestica]